MADFQPLAGLSAEETQQLILITLLEIKEKLPRIDTFDRQTVTIEAGSVGLSANQTLGTLSDLSRLNNFGSNGATFRPGDAVPLHLSNAGAEHIYRQIVVS